MRKLIMTGFLPFLLLFTCQHILAARFWVAATSSNWNNIANWSATSGGAGGASVPVIGDDVNFDNGGLGSCTIDIPVSVKSITVTLLYPGTISQGTNSISTAFAASFSGGIFMGGSANITIGGAFTLNGTAFTSTSGILELDNVAIAFTTNSFLHNSGTVRLNISGLPIITGISPVFFSLEFVGKGNTYTISSAGNITVLNSLNLTGTLFFNIMSAIIDVKGNINSSNTASGCGGDAIININGNSAQTFTGSTTMGAGAIPQLNINTTGSLTLVNFPAVSNNFTYTAGTVNMGTSTFCFTHGNVGAYSIAGSLTFNQIAFPVNTSLLTITIASSITATGDLTISGAANLVLNTGAINVNGNINLSNTGSSGGGSATINIIGAGNQNLDGMALLANQSRLPFININKPGGTLSLMGNISFANNVTYTAGIIAPGTSTCFVVNTMTFTGSISVFNLTIPATSNTVVTVATGSLVSVSNTLDFGSAANFIVINNGTIAVQGNIVDNNTSVGGGGNGVILINGTGNQSITTTGIIDQGRFPGVTMNKPSGTLLLPAMLTVRFDWTYIAGAIDATTNNSTVVFENIMNITGTHTLNNITFNGQGNYVYTTAAGTTLTVTGTLTFMGANNVDLNSGNINLSGNMVLTNTSLGDGGSTVITFLGSANQSITSALPINQSSLPAVTINKTGGTLVFPALLTVRGSWTYTAGTFDVTTNNSTIVFAGPLAGGITMTGTHTLNNVTFEGNNNNVITMSTGTILTVTGTLSTIGVNNVFINTPVLGATAIQAQGNININNTSLAGGGTGAILINGAGAQAFTSTASAGLGQLPYITIQKLTGTLTMTGVFSETRDWNYISGVVDATTNLTTVDFGWDNLIITSAGMNFYHVIFNSNTSTLANNFTVLGNLTINGTGILAPVSNTINVSGNWTDRGTAGFTESTGTVNFNGSALQTITSTGGENFTNVTVNNSSSGIQLINNVQVATLLNMTSGNINLNGNTLMLGLTTVNNGTLSRTSGTMINTGSFIRWFKTATTIAAGSQAGLFPMGTVVDYRPLFISAPTTAPTTGGTIAVSYNDATTNTGVSISDPPNTISVRKDLNWAVTTAGLVGGQYNMQIQGTDYGLIGAVSDLRLNLINSVVATAGANAGTPADPSVNRTGLTAANLTNSFFLGSINTVSSPLPVTLVDFSAFLNNQTVELKWETATETDNDHFTVLRSKDGFLWKTIAVVPGKGNSGSITYYQTTDDKPLSGSSFYKLQNTDIDGHSYFSAVQMVRFSDNAYSFSIYPNPTPGELNIKSNNTDPFSLQIFNSTGQLMRASVENLSTKIMDLSDLSTGVYFIHIMVSGNMFTHSIVIRK